MSYDYSIRNPELQKEICYLLGLDYRGCQQVVITMTLGGTVEVDAKFYAGKPITTTDSEF